MMRLTCVTLLVSMLLPIHASAQSDSPNDPVVWYSGDWEADYYDEPAPFSTPLRREMADQWTGTFPTARPLVIPIERGSFELTLIFETSTHRHDRQDFELKAETPAGVVLSQTFAASWTKTERVTFTVEADKPTLLTLHWKGAGAFRIHHLRLLGRSQAPRPARIEERFLNFTAQPCDADARDLHCRNDEGFRWRATQPLRGPLLLLDSLSPEEVGRLDAGAYAVTSEETGQALGLKTDGKMHSALELALPPGFTNGEKLIARYYTFLLKPRDRLKPFTARIEMSWKLAHDEQWQRLPTGDMTFVPKGFDRDIRTVEFRPPRSEQSVLIRWTLIADRGVVVGVDDIAISNHRPDAIVFASAASRSAEIPLLKEAFRREYQRYGTLVVACDEELPEEQTIKEQVKGAPLTPDAPTTRRSVVTQLWGAACAAPLIAHFWSARITAYEDERSRRRELIVRLRDLDNPIASTRIGTAVQGKDSEESWSSMMQRAVPLLAGASPAPRVELPKERVLIQGEPVTPGEDASYQGSSNLHVHTDVAVCRSRGDCEGYRTAAQAYYDCEAERSGRSLEAPRIHCRAPQVRHWGLKLLAPYAFARSQALAMPSTFLVAVEANDREGRTHGAAQLLTIDPPRHLARMELGGHIGPQRDVSGGAFAEVSYSLRVLGGESRIGVGPGYTLLMETRSLRMAYSHVVSANIAWERWIESRHGVELQAAPVMTFGDGVDNVRAGFKASLASLIRLRWVTIPIRFTYLVRITDPARNTLMLGSGLSLPASL